jgi:hypothetical protein
MVPYPIFSDICDPQATGDELIASMRMSPMVGGLQVKDFLGMTSFYNSMHGAKGEIWITKKANGGSYIDDGF